MFKHSLIPWHPRTVRGAENLRRNLPAHTSPWGMSMDDFFQDFFKGFENSPMTSALGETQGFVPAIDVEETDSEYRLSADLPGLSEEDVHLSLEDNVLTLRGERKSETDEENEGVRRVERSYGSFARSFSMPMEVDAEKVVAHFSKGVLKVTLPKMESAPDTVRQIPIKEK